MKINNITLRCFRNYEQLSLDLSANLNIFTGLNAQGKTNIIEAVHLCSLGISHRTRSDGDLIMLNQMQAKVDIKFVKAGVESELKFILRRGKGRQIELNGSIASQKELPGTLTMVLFSPEDLMLIKGGPLLRRRFLDIELSQTSLLYYSELVRYNKILQQRNSLLKKIREQKALPEMLDMWDCQLAKSAAFLAHKRLIGVDKLVQIAQQIHTEISKGREKLSFSYVIHKADEKLSTVKTKGASELAKWYEEALYKYRNYDIFRGSTSVGIHRDDIAFDVDGIDLKSFGSQGQQRSCVLSLKLSELQFLKGETGEYPVLLLDDVMSELDAGRRKSLLNLLQTKNIQTLITATDKSLFEHTAKENDSFFTVEKGHVYEG